MKRENLAVVRGIFLVAACMLTAVALESLLDLLNNGYAAFFSASFDLAEARGLTSVLSGNFNQIMAVTFTSVAIAVPLTANMYSLKFLEFFIKDRINLAALLLVVVSDLNNSWVVATLRTGYVPVISIHLSLVLATLCFALLVPYLLHIFRFLHPNTLLQLLAADIEADLVRASRHPKRISQCRRQTAESMEHIANIAIRSIDRSDRTTAIESVNTLERVAHAYWRVKPRLADNWFNADLGMFLGFSSKAVDEMNANHSWVEMKLISQLRLVMSAAVPRMHDLASSLAKTLRKLGLEPAARRDRVLREMVVDYFNTFVRLAINRRDPRTVFIVFDQYRLYAESFTIEYPELVQEIAYYFEYYGQVSREVGLKFVVESVAHDLGGLVQHAYEVGAVNRQKLLDRFLLYDHHSSQPLSGVKKAQALLASYLLLKGHAAEAGLIGEHFAGLDPAFVYGLEDDLMHIKREKYWEINERRIHMDYVPEGQREKLREFFAALRQVEAG
jgi:hypothetical protein